MDPRTPVRSPPTEDRVPKRVCVNLLGIFNSSEKRDQLQSKFVSNEITRLQNQRLLARCHKQPHPFFRFEDTSEEEPFTCEIDDNSPSLTSQLEAHARQKNATEVLKDLRGLMEKFSNTIPPFDFKRFDLPSDEPFRIYEMTSGSYVHFGIKQNLEEPPAPHGPVMWLNIGIYMVHINLGNVALPKYLTIFGQQVCTGRTFVIGIYLGDFPIETIGNEILQPLVAELQDLQCHEISFNQRQFRFGVHSVIVDPIANSLVTCTTWPNSMYGCSKCKCRTKFEAPTNTTIYPRMINAELRDDDDFRFCVMTEHHLVTPVLQESGIRLISQFTIDYKYTVCLGVMKKLIDLWIAGELQYRLNNDAISAIDVELMALAASRPSEFRAAPKLLKAVSLWTAYDYRQFLLYYGPIVLRHHLPKPYYVHFLHLNLGIRIALDPQNYEDINYYICGQLIQVFVTNFAKYYGPERVDYNIHNLLHLEDVVRRYTCLEKVSGFSFDTCIENTNVLMRRIITEPDFQLTEVAELISQNQAKTKGKAIINNVISVVEPDNCYAMPNGFAQIKYVGFDELGKIALFGHRFNQGISLTIIPTARQNIYEVYDLSSMEKFYPEQVISKGILFHHKGRRYAMALLSF